MKRLVQDPAEQYLIQRVLSLFHIESHWNCRIASWGNHELVNGKDREVLSKQSGTCWIAMNID